MQYGYQASLLNAARSLLAIPLGSRSLYQQPIAPVGLAGQAPAAMEKNLIHPLLTVSRETWPLAARFTIARGAKSTAEVVIVEISSGGLVGRAECVPYNRYGETVDSVCNQLMAIKPQLQTLPLPTRQDVAKLLPAGAARNALDCALWDLEAKRSGKRCWQLAGLKPPQPLTTAMTIGLNDPCQMAEKAASLPEYPLLKLKLGGPEGDDKRMRMVRAARPDARLIVDANEGWHPDNLTDLVAVADEVGIEVIEQPLPADNDSMLCDLVHKVDFCADESAHTSADLPALSERYDAVNIKLDKTGGLSEALAMLHQAEALGLKTMVGCMVASSLSMAPAMLIAQQAHWVDLDGPLLLAKDRRPGLVYDGAIIHPPTAELWG